MQKVLDLLTFSHCFAGSWRFGCLSSLSVQLWLGWRMIDNILKSLYANSFILGNARRRFWLFEDNIFEPCCAYSIFFLEWLTGIGFIFISRKI
jgi:hypothetical protein